MAIQTLDEMLNEAKKKKKKKKTVTTQKPVTEKLQSNIPTFKDLTGEDLAPVKNSNKKNTSMGTVTQSDEIYKKNKSLFDGWFKKSEGNTSQAITGTGADAGLQLTTGVVGMGESFLDFLASLSSGMYQTQLIQSGKMLTEEDLRMADKIRDDSKEFIKKDLYNEKEVAKKILAGIGSGVALGSKSPTGNYTIEDLKWAEQQKQDINKYFDEEVPRYSVLDEKSHGLLQSTGQLGATVGLSALGVPWWLTTFGTSYGGEMENALNDGATFEQAVGSSLISAGAEVLTEKLSGGISFGGKTLDDGLTNILARSISQKGLRILSKVGMDFAGEGTEEIVSQFMSRLGSSLYKEEDLNEILFSEEAFDEYLTSFISGGVLGGTSSAVNVGKSAVTGTDVLTGYTANEQKVYDKVVNTLIEERGGKKLTSKEKSKIHDEVAQALEEGSIDIETIERTLGEDFTGYDSLVEESKEFEKLFKTPSGELSREQQKRLEELEAKTEGTTYEKMITEARQNISKSAFSKLGKDSRLQESYFEEAKRGQDYEADLTKYDEKQREIIQKAMDSGILNNTKKTHKLVDLIAKVSAEKGVSFDFTNNQKLKESGFAIEGKRVNGFKNGNTITINMQSQNALNTVVGHEITHVLEGSPEMYNAFAESIKGFGEAKGIYQSMYDAAFENYKKIYKDMTEEQYKEAIEKEVVADLVGEYIFTDIDFVRNLSTQNRNVFEKVYDEIKYFLKKVTAGSDADRKLLKAKKLFEEVWRENVEIDEISDANTQYSIREEDPPKETGIAYKVFYVKDGKLYPPMVANPDGAETPMGVWLNADVGTSAPPSKTGRPQVKAGGKGTQGGSGSLAFRPGWHLGDLPRASQFDRVNPETGKKELFPENFVWAEVEYAKDVDYQEEAMSYGYTDKGKFRHAYAGLPRLPENGYYRYRTNPKPDTVPWVITGAMKVNRLLSDAEVNAILEENGVAPVHRQGGDVELEKFGFNNDGTLNENNVDSDVKVMDGGSVVKYSLSTWTPETQTKVRDNLVKAGHDTVQVEKWIDDVNGVASVIAANKDRLDFEAADNQVMLKNNQEYVKTLDASTLCAKRLLYQGTFDAIQHRLPNTALSSDDLIDLLNMMKEDGLETPCSVCYVESRRRHLGKFAQDWLNGYEGEYIPNLDEVTTSDGLEALRHSHPQTYKDFTDAMNKKGSSNPKVVQLRTEYRNDIMKLTPSQVKKIEAIGGLRVQSFSYFETPHLLDMMQAVMDMSAKGLTSQAYTKVPNFAWVFGDTGIKINLSLIAEGDGFDADGNLAFSPTEGMKIEDAMELRDAYSENVGTIIVGANDKHILACMQDDRIDYIIPFHRSGWGKNELKMMHLDSYKDYTYGQNEHDLKTGKGIANLYPPDYWDYNLTGKENAERYLNLCARTGREPKFSEFLVDNGDGSYSLQPDGSTDGYWKTLIDFKMYNNDGQGAAQQKVQPNFNMDQAYRVLNEYEGNANTLPVADEIVEKYVSKYKNEHSDVQYSVSQDTDGNSLSENVRRWAQNTKAVDENGHLKVLHPGTATGEFFTFDKTKASAEGDWGTGFYLTDSDADVERNYEDGGADFDLKVMKLAERIESEEDVDYDTAETMAREQLYKGGYRIDAYVKLENPAIVGETVLFNMDSYMENYDESDFEDYDEYMEQIEQEISDDIDKIVWDIERNIEVYGDSRYIPDVLWGAINEGGIGLEELKHKLNEMYLEDVEGNFVANEVARQIVESLGYDGIIDNTVSEKFPNMGLDADTTHYIVFKPNQIKSITNQNPTDNPDIRYSLSGKKRTVKTDYRGIYSQDVLRKDLIEIEEIAPTNLDIESPSLVQDEVIETPVQDVRQQVAPVQIPEAPQTPEQILYSLEESQKTELEEMDKKVDAVEEEDSPELSVEEQYSAKVDNYKNALDGFNNARTDIEKAFDDVINQKQAEYNGLKKKNTKRAANLLLQIENLKLRKANNLSNIDARIERTQGRLDKLISDEDATKDRMYAKRRKETHAGIVNKIKSYFTSKNLDLDTVLNKAKDLSTFSTVDNTPQRVMEKSLGYKEGQALADMTVNKVAQNETAGIRWVNGIVKELKQISKEYGIKPRSKESAAAQKFAEGYYVDENDRIMPYGEEQLAKEFPDARRREDIRRLAGDPRIRKIYDDALDSINESRRKNNYREIPKRANYFLHSMERSDIFSRLGTPFNPQDIGAADLPTDINGMTADFTPGQPYFPSANARKGYKTTYDLLGGVERYVNSAKNQIFHIEDIQTLRALRNYIADMFGQAQGFEGLDELSNKEVEDRIKAIQSNHLSSFAKFLNEEANIIAGKTSLIDRGLEGIIGRRGIKVVDTINKQVGSNMVGFNVSSALTNLVSGVQAMAKSNKYDTLKAFTQTVSNRIGSIYGKTDGFTEENSGYVRRQGIEKFSERPVEKVRDAGYFLMGSVDSVTSEFILRTKYNELTRKGMSSEQAHIEADKWAHRILGDRTIGQQPQLYNSKMLGLITKFQLEVRNQLDSQFYDTFQEAKATSDNNSKIAAKVGKTMFELAILQHVFGTAFESVAGYNPAFDLIEVLMTVIGADDDEESEDTVLDNIEQGFLALLEDLPYTSTLTGGRIPIESALPIKELIKGENDYGQEKSRVETLKEIAPYYILPTGYGQIKKTSQGLGMFDDDLPVYGSYTDSGNLRFPVDDTVENRVRAGLFGQYANENARDYFDNERDSLKEKQIQEYVDLDLPIREYWDYREGLKKQDTLEDKFEYVAGMDVSVEQKNIMINNIVDRKEKVDMSNYDDFANYEEFDWYTKNTEKYNFLQDNGVSYAEYMADKDLKEQYDSDWSIYKKNPEKVAMSKAITGNFLEYRDYMRALDDIRADKDSNGKSISGSAKAKKTSYIENLPLDAGQKMILHRSLFDSKTDKATYNRAIIEYLESRSDLSQEERVTILEELDMKVHADGRITW